MADSLKPDLCVIGAGSGGLSLAAIAASFGVSVVLVEKGKMGGDCLNSGCVPSKALIAAAERAHLFRHSERFGLAPLEPEIDFSRVHHHVQNVIARIAPNDSVERFTALGVQVIQGEARFTSPTTVKIGETVVEARRFVVASGSKPAIPPIPGLDETPFFTNETIFGLRERPETLLIVGGGPIGVELAQAFRRLGSKVVLLDAGHLLPREDSEMAAIVARRLEEEGVVLHLDVKIAKIEGEAGRIAVHLDNGSEPLRGTHLLIAAGRAPVTEDLGLHAAGIEHDKAGITVDRGLRTTNRRVYAIGDCAAGPHAGYRFTHVANYHAGLVIRSALFRLPVKADYKAIPRVTYCDPELAVVGLSEEDAKRSHPGLRILRWPFAENDRAQAERQTQGHVKAIVAKNGMILGCAIVGARAGDLIVPWALAINKGLKIGDLAGLVFAYPTLSEVSKRAAVEFLRPAAQNPWLRRLIGLLRKFG